MCEKHITHLMVKSEQSTPVPIRLDYRVSTVHPQDGQKSELQLSIQLQ